MLHSKFRLLTALMTAGALFGTSASVATAANDLIVSKEVLKVRPQATQVVDPHVIKKVKLPELNVESWEFGPDNGAKYVTVKLRNDGLANAQPSVLRLTVRRIDGVAVGRTVEVNVPAFVSQADYFVSVATASILPNAVQLKDTTFRLDVDATNTNVEYNETNNTSWHNL